MTFMLRAMGDANSESERVILVEPQAGFAIKTKIENSANGELEHGVKYFVNICHAAEVPMPEVPFEPAVVFPLIMANRWEIPIVTSTARQDQDKKGSICYVSDCCVNTSCLEWVRCNPQLKEILVEWCLESCELRQGIELSRKKLAYPKLRSKGSHIPTLEILKEDLHADPEREARELSAQDRNKDPQAILELRRDLINDEEDLKSNNSLPTLFPQPSTNRKLVEEIDSVDLSLLKQVEKQRLPQAPKAPLTLDVSIGRATSHPWAKLKIEIHSQLTSQEDYEVEYNAQDNSLNVRTKDDNFQYKPQNLSIALPSEVAAPDAKLTLTFDSEAKKLTILL
ncbi:LANO_0H10836g1_1 [Lachancea nothofagi CBS 11611]|uniref:LANO_0H10836g1_1 n=1 Tax=Lachancea nothofagi CBS 11611 TaxID=1266666 RepID=A0A1G4KM77_9SACH|nr:LANO_0H10836g1_1 [Lachancea nothofagi CBS 11611]